MRSLKATYSTDFFKSYCRFCGIGQKLFLPKRWSREKRKIIRKEIRGRRNFFTAFRGAQRQMITEELQKELHREIIRKIFNP